MGKYILGALLIGWGAGELIGFSFWRYFWPVMLIVLGLRILTKEETREWSKSKSDSSDELVEDMIFSATNKKLKSQSFEGGKVNAIFGGGEYDLSGVKLASDKVVLECNVIFGGMKIRIPRGVKVKSEMTAIVGGTDDKTSGEGKQVLVIKGAAIFGGVEIVE